MLYIPEALFRYFGITFLSGNRLSKVNAEIRLVKFLLFHSSLLKDFLFYGHVYLSIFFIYIKKKPKQKIYTKFSFEIGIHNFLLRRLRKVFVFQLCCQDKCFFISSIIFKIIYYFMYHW